MNYTDLNDAFKIDHVKQSTYNVKTIYDPTCIYCSNKNTIPLMAEKDGGIFRLCSNTACRKQFSANITSSPLSNYRESTNHLKSTH